MTAVVAGAAAVVAMAGLTVAGYVVAQHRASAAADLAALAGAQIALRPGAAQSEACAVASQIAADYGGRVEDCQVAGYNGLAALRVTVAVPVARPVPGLPTDRRATAAAGNVDG
jgi:secretion/DNA translocation related TadE-like protein